MAEHELSTSSDETDNLPATSTGEVVVSTQPEGLLVGGDPEAVESYLQRLTESAGYAVQVVGSTTRHWAMPPASPPGRRRCSVSPRSSCSSTPIASRRSMPND